MHAHPSRFHRANIETIAEEEIALYRDNFLRVWQAVAGNGAMR